jgi:hypothetical protein
VHVGDEPDVQGRFQEAVGEVPVPILEYLQVLMYFVDFKCSNIRYKITPDVIGLNVSDSRPRLEQILGILSENSNLHGFMIMILPVNLRSIV